MGKTCLLLEYDGTEFYGWQNQPHHNTIQQTLEKALYTISSHHLPIVGSGRTDSGVHAKGQVAHFQTPNHPLFKNPQLIQKSLNAVLPSSILIRKVCFVDDDFHARYSVIAKEYHYRLVSGLRPSPFLERYCYHFKGKLSLDWIQQGMTYLVGEHDFISLANHGRHYHSTIRRILNISLKEQQDHLLITCKGSGFLYKMVRNIVGLLLDIGAKKIPPEHIPFILEARSRKALPSMTVPAHGLSLDHIDYPEAYHHLLCCNDKISSKEEKTNFSL